MSERELLKALEMLIREKRLIVTSDERHDWQKVDYAYLQPQGQMILVVDFLPRSWERAPREAGGDE